MSDDTKPSSDTNSGNSYFNKSDLAQFGRGLLMGGADIIPGVSGGTVALILGIYERLVTAISHCDKTFLGHVVSGRVSAATKYIDLRFLTFLGIGIGGGVIALGSVMHTLLEDYTQFTFAAFFGMIVASCYLVAKMVPKWGIREVILALAGAVFAYWLVTLPALSNPPDGLWYVFLCGVIAICAMILPGISGAFILLILGKYHDITGIIKETLKMHISVEAITTVVVFAAGCLVGLVSFSKFLKSLLTRQLAPTMAVLFGFMVGSLRKLWPFQIDATPQVEKFKDKIFEVIPFNEITLNTNTFTIIGISIFAGLAVMLLDTFSTTTPVQNAHPPETAGTK